MSHWFKYAFGFLIYSSSNAYAQYPDPKHVVQDIGDFRHHTDHHIKNVVSLGAHLYTHFQTTLFVSLNFQEVVDYLSIHDSGKTLPLEQLQSFGYTHSLPLSERLFIFFGKDKETLKGKEKRAFKKAIAELNRIDKLISEKYLMINGYFKRNGHLTEKGRLLVLIEKIADLVERTQNPVSIEEFGKKMTAPENYMTNKNRFPADIDYKMLFKFLMDTYFSVVNLNYITELENRHSAVRCGKFFK